MIEYHSIVSSALFNCFLTIFNINNIYVLLRSLNVLLQGEFGDSQLTNAFIISRANVKSDDSDATGPIIGAIAGVAVILLIVLIVLIILAIM